MLEKQKNIVSKTLLNELISKEIDARLSDGIYDVSDIDLDNEMLELDYSLTPEEAEKVKQFVETAGSNITIANAYETETIFIFAKRPKELINRNVDNGAGWYGSGFNYGSTNIIDVSEMVKPATKILILAEND